jgi:phosphoribosyl 1,2-cyclic phosphodiesterase
MRVTFYGVRGSIPTPGPDTVRYGGNTSCVAVRLADETLIILDGGTGMRQLGYHLMVDGISEQAVHLCITHMHWDHIIGVPFFAPIYKQQTTVVLHPLVMETPSHVLTPEKLFDGLHFPLQMHQIPSRIVRPEPTDQPWRIGSARVSRVGLNHPGGATGFRIDDGDGASLVFLTDNELNPPGARTVTPVELAKFAEGAGLLVHDAQYLEAEMPEKHGWGHSTIPQVLALGKAAGVRTLALYHHDPGRSDDALDVIARETGAWWERRVRAGRVIVAYEGLTLFVTP